MDRVEQLKQGWRVKSGWSGSCLSEIKEDKTIIFATFYKRVEEKEEEKNDNRVKDSLSNDTWQDDNGNNVL